MSEGLVSPHAGTHVPVLVEEVIHALAPVEGAVMVDGTYGGGGYARAALAVANFTLIGIDRDP
jgi:16S rRNA (cytosine1402-N4)-methyltransferase